jgi:hypothetical protein
VVGANEFAQILMTMHLQMVNCIAICCVGGKELNIEVIQLKQVVKILKYINS